MSFDYDRFLIDQLVRPLVNLYRVTPLAAGETPAGGPVVFVRQKRMALKEDIRFFADESESQELFRIKARSVLDMSEAALDLGYRPVATYETAVAETCRWLVEHTRGRDWREALPEALGHMEPLFDYEAEDVLLRGLAG